MIDTIKKTIEREIWVDNVKVFACVLVVVGHFFQSMISASVLDSNSVYEWFEQSIYMFHVQLFFICSGYLYQKNSRVNTINEWKENVLKKMLTLGVPYFAFSLLTWILKMAFSSSVNQQVEGLVQSLFVNPMSPYWYLYCLFLLFLITPTFKDKKIASVVLSIALIMKIVVSILGCDFYAVFVALMYEIWFVIGICLCIVDIRRILEKTKNFWLGITLAIIFLGSSILAFANQVSNEIFNFLLGLVACAGTILIVGYLFRNNKQPKWIVCMSKYTMPIFLMHTIFAATLRSAMFKVGIENPLVHVTTGLVISFAGPIIAAKIMEKVKWMDFFLHPTKYIKQKGKKQL